MLTMSPVKPMLLLRIFRAFLLYFPEHRQRFEDIIHGRADPADSMNRPHIRSMVEPWKS